MVSVYQYDKVVIELERAQQKIKNLRKELRHLNKSRVNQSRKIFDLIVKTEQPK